jgi:hypothetical protein
LAGSGSFSTTKNPWGSSSGSLGGYSIASSAAEWDLYAAQMGWTNGNVSDEDYLIAVRKALAAAPPHTTTYLTAQNRVEDAEYSIGRKSADVQGLDALIAYDQVALAKMNPDNQHAKTVKQTLDGELATARSRDYGKLVDQVNNGTLKTQALLDWVNTTVSTLPADAPDKNDWGQAQQSLSERVTDEKDSQVYQDYQNDHMTGDLFIAYVTARRDSYDPQSEKYKDWSRRLEDATKNVSDAKFAKEDSAFFNLYNEGKKSDKDYLGYIKTRLDSMTEGDQQYEEWRHRYTTAAFSIAEDQLTYDVQHKKRPVSALVAFYKHYALGLDHGSAEWRQVQNKIDALKGYRGGGGGGASASEGVGSATAGITGKVISGQYTLDTTLPAITPNPYAKPKDQKAALAAWSDNHDRLSAAISEGDTTWMFLDPTTGGEVEMPTSSKALANMEAAIASYHYTLGQIAAAQGNQTLFFTETGKGDDADKRARDAYADITVKDNQQRWDAAQATIDWASKTGDAKTIYNAALGAIAVINQDLADPSLSDARRKTLEALAEKWASNPVLPQYTIEYNPDGSEKFSWQSGGAINKDASTFDPNTGEMTNMVTNPGWHFLLDKSLNSNDELGHGWVQDPADDQVWQENHMTVTVKVGDKDVTGDVTVHAASANTKVYANVDGVYTQIDVPGAASTPNGSLVSEVQWIDQFGHLQKAYSLDGKTFIGSADGISPPMIQLAPGLKLTQSYDKAGNLIMQDEEGNAVLQQNASTGAYALNDDYVTAHPEALGWFNMDTSLNGWLFGTGMDPIGTPTQRYKVYMSDGKGGMDTTSEWEPLTVKVQNLVKYANDAKAAAKAKAADESAAWGAGKTRYADWTGWTPPATPAAAARGAGKGMGTTHYADQTPPPAGLLPKAAALPAVGAARSMAQHVSVTLPPVKAAEGILKTLVDIAGPALTKKVTDVAAPALTKTVGDIAALVSGSLGKTTAPVPVPIRTTPSSGGPKRIRI